MLLIQEGGPTGAMPAETCKLHTHRTNSHLESPLGFESRSTHLHNLHWFVSFAGTFSSASTIVSVQEQHKRDEFHGFMS